MVDGRTRSTEALVKKSGKYLDHIVIFIHLITMPPKFAQNKPVGNEDADPIGPMRETISDSAQDDGECDARESQTASRCAKCQKRKAREGCAQASCLFCCEDSVCEVHKKMRELKSWKEQVVSGETLVQLLAAEKRRQRIPSGRCREPGFLYQGDTLVIWDLRTFSSNAKWKEDAIRKSKRRRATQSNHALNAKSIGPLRNSRRRFALIVEELYQKSLCETPSFAVTTEKHA
jgi:hypothetical protein